MLINIKDTVDGKSCTDFFSSKIRPWLIIDFPIIGGQVNEDTVSFLTVQEMMCKDYMIDDNTL